MKNQDTYVLEREYEDRGWIIRVHKPVLTEEERARRMEEIKKATARFLIAVIEEEKRNEQKKNENQKCS